MTEPLVPHDYQAHGVQWLLERPRAALWWWMGLGKTIAVLLGLWHLWDRGQLGRVLIVAPPRVAHRVWPREIEKWPEFRAFASSYTLLRGANWREKAVHDKAMIHICGFSQLATRTIRDHEGDIVRVDRGLVDLHGTQWPYDTVIFDEASMLKNSTTSRYKAIRKVADRCRRMIHLTGTPGSNGLADLWGQMNLIVPGLLGRTLGDFRNRWFRPAGNGFGYEPMPHALREITELCRPYAMSLDQGRYLDLPPVTHNRVMVDLPAPAMAQYREFEKQMFLALEARERGEVIVEAANAGVLTGKCRQVANGFLYTDPDPDNHDWHPLHTAKFEALDEIIEEAAGEPLIVAYAFRADLERLRRRYPHARTLSRNGAELDPFMRGQIPILLIHPASAGHGIDGMQHACHQLAFFGEPWSLEQYLQTVGRIDRQGQPHPVQVHHIVAAGTVDDRISAALIEKKDVLDALLESVRHAA